MKYKEAMAIGSVLDGVIKCSWAEVFDAEGNKVFTLQNTRFQERIWANNNNKVLIENSKTDTVDEDNNVLLDLVDSEQNVFQSVCECRRYVDGYRVPVVLNRKALRAFVSARDIAESKYLSFKETLDNLLENPKERTAVDEYALYDARVRNYTGHVEKWGKLLDRRNRQIADIEAGKEFWVKVKAFEWYPLNTQNVSSEVRKAEDDLRRAKQLLAASAVATVI